MSEGEKRANIMKLCQVCFENKENIDTCNKHHYCEKCFDNIYLYLTSHHNSCVSCLGNNTKWRK